MRAFPAALTPPTGKVLIPDGKLSAVLDFWVAWLGLTGWTHRCYIASAREAGRSNQGSAVWNLATMHFVISIIDPDDVPEDESYDMEHTLVHELLHVCYAAWLDASPQFADREGTLYDLCVEAPNERVSMVLTELGRAHPEHPLRPRKRRK